MLKKLFLLLSVSVLLSAPAFAISNSDDYLECMKKEASDSGTTKCYKKEIKYFDNLTNDNIRYMKKWDKYASLMKNPQYTLEEQKKAFDKFLDSYCQYYIKSKQNLGYSDEYLEADCRLGYIQMFAGYLNGLIVIGSSVCAEEED